MSHNMNLRHRADVIGHTHAILCQFTDKVFRFPDAVVFTVTGTFKHTIGAIIVSRKNIGIVSAEFLLIQVSNSAHSVMVASHDVSRTHSSFDSDK